MAEDNRYPLLSRIHAPADLRCLREADLEPLAVELRACLLESVSQSGGHFAAGLGTIELTIALHYLYNTPEDRLVWDVGHQAYPHKILTGRRDRITSIRKSGGLAPFPKRDESEFDTFGVGHSSTSIGAADRGTHPSPVTSRQRAVDRSSRPRRINSGQRGGGRAR